MYRIKPTVRRERMNWPGSRPWEATNHAGWVTHHETWEQAMVAAMLR